METLRFVSFLLVSGHCNSSILIVLLNFYSTSTRPGSWKGAVGWWVSTVLGAARLQSLLLCMLDPLHSSLPPLTKILPDFSFCLHIGSVCFSINTIFTFFSSQVRETLSLPSSLFYTNAETLKSCSCETFCFHLLKFWGYLGTFIERVVHGILNLQSHCSV